MVVGQSLVVSVVEVQVGMGVLVPAVVLVLIPAVVVPGGASGWFWVPAQSVPTASCSVCRISLRL